MQSDIAEIISFKHSNFSKSTSSEGIRLPALDPLQKIMKQHTFVYKMLKTA